jgi:hypothetical protein
MANQEHLNILKQGVEVWNQWREEHGHIRPNFSRASLGFPEFYRFNLSNANLSNADLSGASFDGAHLYRTNLSGSDLTVAYLTDVYLEEANLSNTNLFGAKITNVDLNNANLRGAKLNGAEISMANLEGADFSHSVVSSTMFGNLDLRNVKGLETVRHEGPSYLSINTIFLSEGRIPEVFLRGTGAPDSFIEYMSSLVNQPIDYYSCFISYSSKDQTFAERLYADFQSNNVRCWFAPEDLKIGDKFWHRIDESIRIYDKLLVVLSEHSVQSDWVEREVMAALEKEKQGKTVLFPITLDDAVKDCTAPWAADLRRQRHIGDFRNWKNHDDYQKAFERLLRDLKASA